MLAKAGFFEPAADQSRPDDPAWLGALAGLGRLELLAEARESVAAAEIPDRRWIAGLAAAWSPQAVLDLLEPSMAEERAACLLALGEEAAATALLDLAVRSPERSLLLAMASAQRRDWKTVRAGINAAFEAQGLDVPLRQPEGGPPSLAEFEPAVSGRVEGPLVSVVVAARNAATTLEAALASLTRQTWSALEVLVVDDGSKDKTAEIARRLGAADSRIRLLKNAGPAGPSGARNTGLAAATGAFVTFHDADDWAHPRRVEQQVAAVQAGRRVAAVSKHFRLGSDGAPAAPRVFPVVRLAPISVLARAEAVSAAGPYEVSDVGADSEYLARLDLLFGRPAVTRLDKIHIVAAWAPTSISGAGPTGLATAEGRAAREAYERDWRVRHAQRVAEGLP